MGTTKVIEQIGDTMYIGSNGDKYWVRPFNAKESIERAREYECQGKEPVLKCGLELQWAKLHLGHGAWYPYLLKIGMDTTTAWRRMQVAHQFLEWAKIISVGDKVTKEHMLKALEMVHSQIFHLKDFTDYLQALNADRISKSIYHSAYGSDGSVGFDNHSLIPYFSPARVVNYVRDNWASWTIEEQVDAAKLLSASLGMFKGLIDELHDRCVPEEPVMSKAERIEHDKEMRAQLVKILERVPQ